MVHHAELSSKNLINKITKKQVYYYSLRHFVLKLVERIAACQRTSLVPTFAHSLKDETSQQYFSAVTSARDKLLTWTMLDFLPLDFIKFNREKGLFKMDYNPSLKGFCNSASNEMNRIVKKMKRKKSAFLAIAFGSPKMKMDSLIRSRANCFFVKTLSIRRGINSICLYLDFD